ncbi:MAG TPA: NAD(+)/NADH kinase [Candidatus Gastranaerophilales bacterium]|nr:NAD(+)/NADH kinase [Candidatus Gastranaerophilales bacterium]
MPILKSVKSLNNKLLNLQKIGIVYNVEHESAEEVAGKLENILVNKGFTDIAKYSIRGKRDKTSPDTDLGLVFIVGGDGTFLGAARCFSPCGIPLFGINTGRLGFLSQLKPYGIEQGVEKILKGDFIIEERLMIKSYISEEQGFQTALNDVVIKGGEVSRAARLFLYINGKHVCDYLADGLIISTPTGSTAYTLSAGGPVVVPELEAFVIAPICPHSLTTRPIVIPANEKIEVKVKLDSDYIYITSDGQENLKISGEKTILITKNDYKARLITLKNENNGFYSILREKLHWGISPYCQD